MIEINFTAKGESLKELLQHMDMALDLIQLQENKEVLEDSKNNGKTETSSYEYSIKFIPPPKWITGVAIKGVINQGRNGMMAMVKGDHAKLIRSIISEGKTFSAERIEGFILNDGTFLNRIEALKTAIINGQLKRPVTGSKLYSQDLW